MRTINLKKLTIGAAVGFVLAGGAIGNVEAKDMRYRESSSSTFSNTAIDTNGDGTLATLSLYTGHTNLGQITGQGVFEYLPIPFPPPPPTNCPAGTVEFQFVVGRGVNTFKDGDQLILVPGSSLLCADPTTGLGTFHNIGVFAGGTGRFAGATGSFETRGTVAVLLVNQLGSAEFGLSNFEITGTLTLP